MRLSAAILCVAAVCVAPGPARAANCFISTSGLAFGSYNPLAAAPLNGSGTIRVNCNGWITVARVLVSAGTSGAASTRAMANGAERLGYNVYSDAACTQVWSDAPPGVAIGPFFSVTLALYGRIPAGQDVAVGTYTDTLTITVDY